MIVRSSRQDAASTSADACAEASDAAAGLDKIAAALESGEKRVLRQHEEVARDARRFRTLLAHAADGLVLIDENPTFLYASPTTTHMLGVSLDEFVGRDAAHFAHADDKPAVLASLHEILGTPRAFSSLTVSAQRPDGSIRWVDAEASNLLTEPAVSCGMPTQRVASASTATSPRRRRGRISSSPCATKVHSASWRAITA